MLTGGGKQGVVIVVHAASSVFIPLKLGIAQQSTFPDADLLCGYKLIITDRGKLLFKTIMPFPFPLHTQNPQFSL